MGAPIGGEGHLGLRVEGSYASGGSIEHWMYFNSEGIVENFANIYTDKVGNTAEQVSGQQGLATVTGPIEFSVTPQCPTEFWQVGLGQATSPYYAERAMKSMILQIDRETAAIQASGCRVGSMTFSSEQGTELICTVEVEAAGLASVAAGSPTYTADDPPYTHADAEFSLNGSADNSITAFTVVINNNLVTDLFGTSRERLDIPAGKLQVTGTFTKLFDDTTERNAFLNEQVRSFKVDFKRGERSFILWIKKLRYDTRAANIGSQSEYILETFNFTGYVDDTTRENSIRISGDTSG